VRFRMSLTLITVLSVSVALGVSQTGGILVDVKAAGPAVHQVRGSFVFELPWEELRIQVGAIQAQIDANANVTGHLHARVTDLNEECCESYNLKVEIGCLAVEGNEAWVGGTIVRIHGDPIRWEVGDDIVLRLQDNGNSSDEDQANSSDDLTASACESKPAIPLLPLESGNVLISSQLGG